MVKRREELFMPRTGKNIYKRKDGRWEGRYIKSYSESGRAVYGSVYAQSYRDAKAKLERAMKSDDEPRNIEVPAERPDESSTEFREAASEWLKSIQPRVKESTGVKYLNLLESYIQPTIGSLPLSDLTREQIESQCLALLSAGGSGNKGLSPQTVSSVLFVIRSVLEYAARSGKHISCDVKGIKITQKVKEMRILSQNERERLCGYVSANPTPPNLGVLLCLCAGLRVGEICALRWEDISLSERTIRVHQTMQRIQDRGSAERRTKVIVTTPKSSCSIRTIPLPDDLVKLIKAQGVFMSGYFLTGNEKYLEPRTMQNHFKRILKELSIPPVNFHALRHTFATNCVELGFDVKTLSVILGHASVNITMNRYVHPSMSMKQENMRRISLPFLVK